MSIRSISRIKNLSGKRVLVRVDFNVPLKGGKVADDTRLLAHLPTIAFLVKKKAKVILVSHIGRPGGKQEPSLSLQPVAKRLSELLKTEVILLPFGIGADTQKKVHALGAGRVALMENIRFYPGEEADDEVFARELSALADIFVLDGFAVAHRAGASITGIARYLPAYAGLLLAKEIRGLSKVTTKSKNPLVAIIGGAKTETKIPIIKNLLPKADSILVGGGIVNTYLAARGYGVGKSLVDTEYKEQALAYCKKRKVILPTDVVVGTADGNNFRVVKIEKKPHEICRKNEGIYDIGPQTIELFSRYIQKAKTLVWNGAMGVFEVEPFSVGTLAVAGMVAEQSKKKICFGVIGGGETLQSMEIVGGLKDIDLVSTGGGAMLEFLAGKRLPGIAVLAQVLPIVH